MLKRAVGLILTGILSLGLWSGCGRNEVRVELKGIEGRQVRLAVTSKIMTNFNALVSEGQTFPEAEESDYVATVATNTCLEQKRVTVCGKPLRGIKTYTISFDVPPDKPMVPQGTLVFASDRDGPRNWEIYAIRADGSGLTNLTRTEGSDTEPAWSPDGTKIAFVTDRDGITTREIYVMDADGSNQTRLTEGESFDRSPAWSPDGSKIAFSSQRTGSDQIFVMNADGSNPVQVSDGTASDRLPAWSPDGSKIAFVSDRYGNDRKGNDDIFLMNADGSKNVVRLTEVMDYDLNPSWSHDGRFLLFSSSRDGAEEVFIMKSDGTLQTRLTLTDDFYEWEPVWSPDDLGFAFAGGKGRNYDIYLTDRTGRNRVNLTNDAYQNRHPSWRPF
ncbi:MAG: hypothetical protein DRP97_04300 [Candidatus Latescibacterota bacterium]|nr:PD40 domain-containing protein [Candidatus Latescibacterota bacterium]RKY70108.1 MAG: hypothetical protein DRP97_04300 [Candidatus Latescibacterota bacterium]